MADFRPGCRRRQRCAAGIGKEVQDPNGPPRRADLLHNIIPVGRLLREDTGVLEIHRLDVEGQRPVLNLPALR